MRASPIAATHAAGFGPRASRTSEDAAGAEQAMPQPPVLNVGFYNYVMTDKIVALVSSESAPMRRLVQYLRKTGNLIDATQGRRTKCIIFTAGPAVVLSAISQETLAKRLAMEEFVPDEE
jgi:regulator of extracellular matrix RemA (YlzA/DUF370 family)